MRAPLADRNPQRIGRHAGKEGRRLGDAGLADEDARAADQPVDLAPRDVAKRARLSWKEEGRRRRPAASEPGQCFLDNLDTELEALAADARGATEDSGKIAHFHVAPAAERARAADEADHVPGQLDQADLRKPQTRRARAAEEQELSPRELRHGSKHTTRRVARIARAPALIRTELYLSYDDRAVAKEQREKILKNTK